MNDVTFEKRCAHRARTDLSATTSLRDSDTHTWWCPPTTKSSTNFHARSGKRLLQNHDACLNCSECRKAIHNNHPDVYHVFPTKDKIKVDDIEQMLDTVSIKPLSGHKIYFIHRADQMNAQAQNKLLKTLEEPPKDVTIFSA